MSEAADAAELAAARVARKHTNKGRAAESLQRALLPLPSKMLPMLRLLNKKRWLLLLKCSCHRNQTKVVLASEDDKADTDKNESDDDCSDDDDDTAKLDDDGDTDQVQGVLTQNGSVQVRVCLLSCAEEVFNNKLPKF